MITDDPPTPRVGSMGRADRRPGFGRAVAEVVGGVAAPLALAAALSATDDPDVLWPGALLLAVVVGVAVVLGSRAGWAASATSIAVLWWQFLDPRGVPADAWSRLASLASFSAAVAGVMLLVTRHERARRRARAEERTTGELLDQSPVGIALLDTDLRFIRVNRSLADITGARPEDHVGRRVSEIDAALGATHEPVLHRVARSGEAVTDRVVSRREPVTGSEQHWRTSYFPVRGADGRVHGVGVAVEEVTADVVARRRSDLLLGLTRQLTAAHRVERLGAALTAFLADAFEARAVVAVPGPGGDELQVLPDIVGYGPDSGAAWGRAVFALDEQRPLCEAARTRRIVAVASAEDWDRRFPPTADARAASGEEACVCVPVVDPIDDGLLAVFRVSWTHRRELTETTRTLCDTVASLTASALKRMRLAAEQAQDRFRSALEAMLDHVAIGEAVRVDGRIVDFRIVYVNGHGHDVTGRSAVHLIGRRISELYPGATGDLVVEHLAAVVETGRPEVLDRFRAGDVFPELQRRPPPGTPGGPPGRDADQDETWWSVQVSRLGDGFIGAWRDVSDVVRLERAGREAERAVEREAISVELLQRAALPQRLPTLEGITVGADYRPASEQPVGGDWFDAFGLDERSVAVVIADVAGHGTDAAAAMVQVRNILRAMAVEHRSPHRVLRLANDVITALGDDDAPFVTACFGVVELGTGTFSWASAGHLPPLLLRDGRAIPLDAPRNPPLAVAAGLDFGGGTVDVRAGDRLVLYTDGLVERRGEIIDVGLDRLARAALEASVPGRDAQGLAELLGASVTLPRDDLAVVVVDIDPAGRGRSAPKPASGTR